MPRPPSAGAAPSNCWWLESVCRELDTLRHLGEQQHVAAHGRDLWQRFVLGRERLGTSARGRVLEYLARNGGQMSPI